MPKQKDLKRRVRERMKKTGEAYTTARRHLVSKRKTSRPTLPSADECAKLAGIADDTVKAKTGRTWRQWTVALDAVGATELPHRDIAKLVREEHGTSMWWAQSITVGYERIRGLRARGQRRKDGKPDTFDANKSRTYPVPVESLWREVRNVGRRRKWLTDVEPEIRKATPPKSLRMSWPDGTRVQLWFTDKGAKSSVQVQHGGLPTAEAAAEAKRRWHDRLDALRRHLRERKE